MFNTREQIYIYIYTYTYVYIYIKTYIHIHTYIFIHLGFSSFDSSYGFGALSPGPRREGSNLRAYLNPE